MCCATCNAVLKAGAPQTGRDAQEKTRWRASRFFFFALWCSGYEPCEVKRGPKPCLVEATLTTWIDECADEMVCRTLSEITDEAQARADKKTSVQNPALPCKVGKTGWKLFKRRSSAFVSRLARLTPQQWTEFFNIHLKPGLKKVVYNPCHILNEDESGFVCQFSTVGQHVWVRKGRKTVARRCRRQRQHITAIVAVNARGQATKPAPLWNTKKRADIFLRAQCPVTLKERLHGWSSLSGWKQYS